MCLRNIYHNTYGDGSKDITERVEPCTPGFMCAHPRVVEYDRNYNVSRREAKAAQAKSNVRVDRPGHAPPSPAGSRSRDRRDSRSRTDIYVNGKRLSTPARPIPIPAAAAPLHRSSTLPLRRVGLETPPPERGRRPIVIEDRPSRTSAASFGSGAGSPGSPAFDVHEHATSARLRQRHDQRASDFLNPHLYRPPSPPQGYASADDERSVAERRHRRNKALKQAAVHPSSVPTQGHTDHYGASYDSLSGASGAAGAAPSPAAAAVKKELRWEDEQRREHNSRISMRPKLPRTPTADAQPRLHSEVKSILKNTASATPSPRTSAEIDGVSDHLAGLGIHDGSRREPRDRDRDSTYDDRLRNRFSLSQQPPAPPPLPRRYTAGGSFRRRSEIWYPEAGRTRLV